MRVCARRGISRVSCVRRQYCSGHVCKADGDTHSIFMNRVHAGITSMELMRGINLSPESGGMGGEHFKLPT